MRGGERRKEEIYVRPWVAMRTATSTKYGTRSRESGRAAYLQKGLAAAICGASWKPPMDSCSAKLAPPRRIIGQLLDQALARPAMP